MKKYKHNNSLSFSKISAPPAKLWCPCGQCYKYEYKYNTNTNTIIS